MTFDDLAIAMSSNIGGDIDSIMSRPSPYQAQKGKLTFDNLAILNDGKFKKVVNNPYEN